ncbi:MAG: HAMP domain-containing histidine kinase [Myxococcales bacterium]|nr:HAMP domain-containing histidine kinase [Myxococcales bacterium]
MFFVAYRADLITHDALEEALENQLVAAAQAVPSLLPEYITVLSPGDDTTRTFRRVQQKLMELREAVSAQRILVVEIFNNTVLVDTSNTYPIGAPYRRAKIDHSELQQVQQGHSAASILFEGPNHEWLKTGYAPVVINDHIRAYVAIEAPVTYHQNLSYLRQRLALVITTGLGIMGCAAIIFAGWVARPLQRLSVAAQAIGNGALDTPIPRGGPAEAHVLAETMAHMCASLKTRDEHMQMMLAGIAHEVRNPLGGIELFGGILREDLEGDPRQSNVNKILDELTILAKVVNDFLDYARRKPIETFQLSIDILVDEVVELSRASALERGIVIQTSSVFAHHIQADGDELRRAVINLVQNAIQAAPPSGLVQISCAFSGPYLHLIVDDNGPGVPDKHRKRVFTPFYTTKQKGTGLGLALAYQTAVHHNGQLWVETSPIGGARFILTLGRPYSGR